MVERATLGRSASQARFGVSFFTQAVMFVPGCCFHSQASKFLADFAPAGAEILFFALPKKSIQKKGGPQALTG